MFISSTAQSTMFIVGFYSEGGWKEERPRDKMIETETSKCGKIGRYLNRRSCVPGAIVETLLQQDSFQ